MAADGGGGKWWVECTRSTETHSIRLAVSNDEQIKPIHFQPYSRFCMRMDSSRKERPILPCNVCRFSTKARAESR